MCVDRNVIVKVNQVNNANDDKDNVINNFNYEEFEFEKEEENCNNNQNINKIINTEQQVDQVKNNDNPQEKNGNENLNESHHSSKDKIDNVFLHNPEETSNKEEEQKNEDVNEFRAPTKSKAPNPQINTATNNLHRQTEDDLEKIESVSHRNNMTQNEEKENTEELVDTVSKKHPKKKEKQIFPDIFSIIPEKLLLNCDQSELLFLSELKKMININVRERVKYTDRFCMVTKENFIIYNSKENYINLKRPLAVLPINQIIRVVLFKLNQKKSGYDHFYICFDKNKNTELIYAQINTFFMNEEMNKENEVLLMFKSDSSDLIKKWYVVLDYLIKESRNPDNNDHTDNNENNQVEQIEANEQN